MNIFEPKVSWPIAVPLKPIGKQRYTIDDVICSVRLATPRLTGEQWEDFQSRTLLLAYSQWEVLPDEQKETQD